MSVHSNEPNPIGTIGLITQHIAAVSGIGVDDERHIIFVYTTRSPRHDQLRMIPRTIDDYRVVVRRVGRFRTAR